MSDTPVGSKREMDLSQFEGATRAPWCWHHTGRSIGLSTPDRGRLVVMDLARKGMQGCEPRFAHWEGIENGEARGRRGGVLESGIDHPDARLIAAAPELLEELRELRQLRTAYEWLTNGDSGFSCGSDGLDEIEWRDPCGEGDKTFTRNTGETQSDFVVRAYRDAMSGVPHEEVSGE